MAWHDHSPWKRKRDELKGRIERIRDVLSVYDAGDLTEGKALSRIEEIASGEDDPIVRIPNKPHTPEIET